MHVVLFHTAPAYLTWAPSFIQNIVSVGFVGVSFFFLLSGFILAYNYLPAGQADMRGSHRAFWWARFARVYPLYATGLLLALPFFLKYLLDGLRGQESLTNGLAALVTAPLLLQSWWPSTACTWNCPGWSLSNEAFFYLLFPFLAVPIMRLARAQLVPVGIGLLLITLAFPVLYMVLNLDGLGASATVFTHGFWIDWMGSNPISHVSEFLLGVIAGRYFVLRQPRASALHWVLGLGGALVTLALMALAPHIPYPLMQHGILDLTMLLMIYHLAATAHFTDRHMERTGLIIGGEVSYALYLLHFPIWVYFAVAGRMLPATVTGSLGYWVLYLVVTLGVSYAAYRWIEEPARKYIRHRTT